MGDDVRVANLRAYVERAVTRIGRAAGYDLDDLTLRRSLAGLDQRERAEIHRWRREREPRRFLEGAMELLLAQRGHLTIVQVGANDGVVNDPLYDFAMRHKDATRLLLVEPQLDMIPHLKRNYDGHPDATIVQTAVGHEGTLTLHRIRPELARRYRGIVASGIASIDSDYVESKARRLLTGRTHHDPVEMIQVDSVPLRELLTEHEARGVDVILTDTEGFDDEVIYSADIGDVLPVLLAFESVMFDAERTRRIHSHLEAAGYRIVSTTTDDECAVLATW